MTIQPITPVPRTNRSCYFDKEETGQPANPFMENPLDVLDEFPPAEYAYITEEKKEGNEGNNEGLYLSPYDICRAHQTYQASLISRLNVESAKGPEADAVVDIKQVIHLEDEDIVSAKDNSAISIANPVIAATGWKSSVLCADYAIVASGGRSAISGDNNLISATGFRGFVKGGENSVLSAGLDSNLRAEDGSVIAVNDGGVALAGNDSVIAIGCNGIATVNDNSIAAVGDEGMAVGGNRVIAAAGDEGQVFVKDNSIAVSCGTAVVGNNSSAVVYGDSDTCRAKGGTGSLLTFIEVNEENKEYKHWKTIYIDGVRYLPNTWYRLKDGKIERAIAEARTWEKVPIE